MKKDKQKPGLMAREYVPILGIKIHSARKEEVLNRAWEWVVEAKSKLDRYGQSRLIVTPNPEITSLASDDPGLAEILNKADLSVPDGHGLIWAARILGQGGLKEVAPGRWLMERLVHRSQGTGIRMYLLGGEKGVAAKAAEALMRKYNLLPAQIRVNSGPWLDKRGFPVNNWEEKKEKQVLAGINEFAPHLLFVALGAPKQEKWLARNLPQLRAGVAMTVGGAFDYLAERVPVPPKFIETAGLEWFWRLMTQPRRAPRIFTAAVIFPLKVLQYKFFSR